MAIIKLGSTVTGIRGSIGSVTYSAAKGGPYARAWGKGTNPRAAAQMSVRGNLGGLGAVWQGMTAGDRAGWDAYAATNPEPTYNSLGEPVSLSGWGYFCRFNSRRLRRGDSVSTTVPAGPESVQPAQVVVLIGFHVAGPPVGVFYAWDVVGLANTYRCVYEAKVFVSAAKTGAVSRASYMRAVDWTLGSYNWGADVAAKFGDVRQWWWITGRLWCESSFGIRSIAKVVDGQFA